MCSSDLFPSHDTCGLGLVTATPGVVVVEITASSTFWLMVSSFTASLVGVGVSFTISFPFSVPAVTCWLGLVTATPGVVVVEITASSTFWLMVSSFTASLVGVGGVKLCVFTWTGAFGGITLESKFCKTFVLKALTPPMKSASTSTFFTISFGLGFAGVYCHFFQFPFWILGSLFNCFVFQFIFFSIPYNIPINNSIYEPKDK